MATTNISFPEPLENFFYFAEDQVLTAGQLNQLAGHFDWEHRRARTRTQGIGIVCGLDVRKEGNTTIRIGKGVAITSAGDLLQLGTDTPFTHYRKIQATGDVPTDGSTRLLKIGTEPTANAVWTMWRLYDQPATDRQPLTSLGDEVDLNDLAVLLFLDSYLKAPEVCTDTNCDNMGITQINETMVLLLPKAALAPPMHNPNRFHEIPHVAVSNPRMNGIKGVAELQNRFEMAVGAVGGGSGSLQGIRNALDRICTHFSDVWNTFSAQNPIGNWGTRLDTIVKEQQDKAGILYVYDFFRDLSEAINEFREAVFDLPGECCPSPALFPKYVMLSEYTLENGRFFPRYRHYFNEAPILNHADLRREKANFLLRRIDLMIQSFDIPLPANADAIGQIRITPSRLSIEALGDRAIPFYYNITDELPLNQYWNFDKTRRGMGLQHQGYRMRDRANADPSVRTPFDFDLAKYGFYRVEGYHGLDAQKAVAEIERQKQDFNLGFKVKSIQIEDSEELLISPKFVFPELDILHRHYREELYSNLHLVKNFGTTIKDRFSGLSVVEQDVFKTAKDPDDTDVFTNINAATTTTLDSFDTSVSTVQSMMFKPLSALAGTFTDFRAKYDKAVDLAHSLNSKVYYANQATIAPPTHKLILDNSFTKFDHLINYYGKKKVALTKQHIFDQFYDKNTGLAHQGGVSEGGTLVLLYSSTNKRIVADFYLPYCCELEVPEIEDHTPIPIPGIAKFPDRFKWIDKFDLYKTPRIPKDINNLRLDDYIKLDRIPTIIDNYVKDDRFKTQVRQNLLNDYALKGDLALYAKTNELATNYASKAELVSNYAAKSDLIGYASKSEIISNYAAKGDLAGYASKAELVTNYAAKGELAGYAKREDITSGATTIFNEKYFDILAKTGGFTQKGNFAGLDAGLAREIELVEDPAERLQLYQIGLMTEELRYLKTKGTLEPNELTRAEILEKDLSNQLGQITTAIGTDAHASEKTNTARANYVAGVAGIANTIGAAAVVNSIQNRATTQFDSAVSAGNLAQVIGMGTILRHTKK